MRDPVHLSSGSNVSFGEWLKQQRREVGITRDELAERTACSSEMLKKLESGERRPSRQIALSLAQLFHVPADEHEAFVTFARTLSSRASVPTSPAFPVPLTSPTQANAQEQEQKHAHANSPWRAVHLGKSNLPLVLTILIGREQELNEVCSRLRQPKMRLLTLSGPPGVGKTRLSIEVAATLLGDFEDGVYLVELAPLSDPGIVIPYIARALDLRETAGQSIEETLLEYIKDRRMLLVLDNFEHLLDAGPEVVKLIQASPWLKVLVTSREALHVRGERQYPLPPLRLPALASRADRLNLEELAYNPAVELFVERAEEANAHFALTEENALEVAEVCVNLDGLPLAIELAAARVSLFPPKTLLTKLGQQLNVLTGGSRDLPPRQRTLRGAIEWSYDLLADAEKQLFSRMAVFQGGRTLEALEAVCNSEALQIEGKKAKVDVLDSVETLLSSNLLQQREGSEGEPRFWMLETIHEYAREKLQGSGEADDLHKEHALYFMRLAEEAESHLVGAKETEWLSKLEDEHDNIRAALRWAVEGKENGESCTSEDLEIGLRTAGSIWRFWQVRGYWSEGREWFGRLLTAADLDSPGVSGCSNQSRAKVLNGVGGLCYSQGNYSVGRTALEEALSIGRKVGDKWSMGLSLNILGNMAYEQSDYSAARLLYEESLLVKKEIGDVRGIASTLNNLGNVTRTQGDYETARILYEEGLTLGRQQGSKQAIAFLLRNLGRVATSQRNYQKARALHEESLLLRRELEDKSGIADCLNHLGGLALQDGDYALARSLCDESLAMGQEVGSTSVVAASLGNLGNLAFMQEDYALARTLYRRRLVMEEESGSKLDSALSIVELGAVAAVMGHAEQGARMMGAAEALYELIGAVMEPEGQLPYERGLAAGQSGEAASERAWQEGRAMSIDQAIEYARQES